MLAIDLIGLIGQDRRGSRGGAPEAWRARVAARAPGGCRTTLQSMRLNREMEYVMTTG